MAKPKAPKKKETKPNEVSGNTVCLGKEYDLYFNYKIDNGIYDYTFYFDKETLDGLYHKWNKGWTKID
jgi:hypothetical protein